MPSIKFPYLSTIGDQALLHPMPYVPLALQLNGLKVDSHGLIDSGSTVNVLPFHLGLELGANWDSPRVPLQLVGNLANFEARALFVRAEIRGFESVELAFAWTSAQHSRLILGQTNFFSEFDVFLFGQDKEFELKLR